MCLFFLIFIFPFPLSFLLYHFSLTLLVPVLFWRFPSLFPKLSTHLLLLPHFSFTSSLWCPPLFSLNNKKLSLYLLLYTTQPPLSPLPFPAFTSDPYLPPSLTRPLTIPAMAHSSSLNSNRNTSFSITSSTKTYPLLPVAVTSLQLVPFQTFFNLTKFPLSLPFPFNPYINPLRFFFFTFPTSSPASFSPTPVSLPTISLAHYKLVPFTTSLILSPPPGQPTLFSSSSSFPHSSSLDTDPSSHSRAHRESEECTHEYELSYIETREVTYDLMCPYPVFFSFTPFLPVCFT